MSASIAPSATTETRLDRFGNPIDPRVGFARGSILRGEADEVRRGRLGRRLIRARVQQLGEDSVYNLTGLTRAGLLTAEDARRLTSQIAFYAHYDGRAEPLAIGHLGGDPAIHDAVLVTRVSAGMLAIHLAIFDETGPLGAATRRRVVSIVPGPTSHPSIRKSATVAGAEFHELVGYDAAARWLTSTSADGTLVVLSLITPSKLLMPLNDSRRLIQLAKDRGFLVLLDDAHTVTRFVFFEQPRAFEVGPADLAIASSDKHMNGPRAGMIVATNDLLALVRAKVYEFGLEAAGAHYVGVLHALERFEGAPVKAAGAIADELMAALVGGYGPDRVYRAGPGVALSAEDVTELVRERAPGRELRLVPAEVSTFVCQHMLRTHGMMTIPTVGMPGSAPATRIMTFPDGERRGVPAMLAAFETALAAAATVIDDPAGAASGIVDQS